MGWSGGTYTRSDGVFTGSEIWESNRDAGTKIVADRHDTHDQDLATGINSCINKDGSNAATGALNLGSQKITALADGTAHTDGINAGQIQDGGLIFQATDSGSANAYAIALTPAVTAYVAGQVFHFKAANANTGNSTLNVNALGTKNIKKRNDQNPAAGDIEANAIISVIYDGTSFQMISQLGTSAGSMTSFTLTGDSGSNQTIVDGNTLDVAGGTGIDTVVGSTDTVTVAIDSSVVQKTAQNTFTKAQVPSTYTAALSATSGVLDYDTYQNFIITLASGSNTLAAATTEASQVGQTGAIIFIQPGSSSAGTISLHGDYETAAAGGLTLSTANNDYDIVPYMIKADNSILLGAPQLNFG
tara:strand:+ start:61 stop:1137 length:1077 start_codon:yes stop_codon:yes gene_type:complete